MNEYIPVSPWVKVLFDKFMDDIGHTPWQRASAKERRLLRKMGIHLHFERI